MPVVAGSTGFGPIRAISAGRPDDPEMDARPPSAGPARARPDPTAGSPRGPGRPGRIGPGQVPRAAARPGRRSLGRDRSGTPGSPPGTSSRSSSARSRSRCTLAVADQREPSSWSSTATRCMPDGSMASWTSRSVGMLPPLCCLLASHHKAGRLSPSRRDDQPVGTVVHAGSLPHAALPKNAELRG